MSHMTNGLPDAWYPLALSTDIGNDGMLARRLHGEYLVVYRRADASLVALEDRCPHRFAPLSQGQRSGDDITCPYHGLRFNSQGQCVHNPHGDGRIPAAARVRSFAIVERHGIVWCWPGSTPADPARIPDLSFMGSLTDTAVFSGYLQTPAHFEVVIDNLLDLSHADFLHPTLLGTGGAMPRVRPDVSEQSDGSIRIRLLMDGRPAMALFAPFLPQPEANASTLVEITWWLPGIVHIAATAWQGERESRDDSPSGLSGGWPATTALHLVAPETETSSHYSFIGRRNFLVDDAEFTRRSFEVTHRAFAEEDKPMLAAVQSRMVGTDLLALKPVLLSSDAGAIRVRRRMAEARQQAAAG